jgi:hypothetical protein
MDAVRHGIGSMAALHILVGSGKFLTPNCEYWKSCLCFTVGLASGHVVFTIASFLAMWRLHLEVLSTMDAWVSATGSMKRVDGGDVALY